jgi:prepilin peptidase CpaA
MNLLETAPAWLLGLLILLLIGAAIEDAVRLRISNITCLGALITVGIAMALAGFPLALWQNLAGFAAVLAIGTFLFSRGQMGGGDVKLLAALALWFNLIGLLWLLAAVSLAGGVLALGFILARLLRRQPDGPGKQRKSRGIPYGIAIVVGAALTFALQMRVAEEQKPKPFTIGRLNR